jgi:hypothetical protein
VLLLPGLGVAEFDSAARVVPFPVHKARKPLAEPAGHGSAIIRTLGAVGFPAQLAQEIVEAKPLPEFCSACGTGVMVRSSGDSDCACFENDDGA